MQVSKKLKMAKLWQGVGWFGVLTVLYLSLAPSPPGASLLVWDYFFHGLAYFCLAWWFRGAFSGVLRWALFLLALGLGLEFIQEWSGFRAGELSDALSNATGVVLGTITGAYLPLVEWLDKHFAPLFSPASE